MPDIDFDRVRKLVGIHERIAADVPQIARGKVWCRTCGREQSVNGAECLRSGWPKCHGATMSIDPPSEEDNPHA